MNWTRAKPHRPIESKSSPRIYGDNDLGLRARKAMRIWKKTLTERDRRRLAAVTP